MTPPFTPEGADALLRLDHVSKRYSGSAKALAVDDVSLAIRPGETFGLVGESGSGKTTIARMILRLEPVTKGRIWFMGQELTTLSAEELRHVRHNLQIVFQDPLAALNRRKTVGEIIEFPLRIHGPRDPAARKGLVNQVLDLAGLPNAFVDRYPHELSGGLAQRVGIARAIVLKPRLLVLDEAVSSLDVSIRAQILNLLRDLQQRLGLTYLFISHDLSVVRYMSDQVGVMFRGRIVESGSRTTLFSHPLHPYTEELLSAAPGHSTGSNGAKSEHSQAAPGTTEHECRYRSRCYLGHNAKVCGESDPGLAEAAPVHWVACHLRATDGLLTPMLEVPR